MEDFYRSESLRLQRVFKDNGISVTVDQAYDVWSERSETMAAGWLSMPEDDEELFNEAERYLPEVLETSSEKVVAEFEEYVRGAVNENAKEEAEYLMGRLKKLIRE